LGITTQPNDIVLDFFAGSGTAAAVTTKMGRQFIAIEQMDYIEAITIEPKGNPLIGKDKWKEDFLKEIRAEQKTIRIDTDPYLITALPFYNYDKENEFKAILENTLNA
jgi:adenine specific DNA methylase Mod